MQAISKLLSRHRELILYGVIGCGCASLDFLIYSLILLLAGDFYVILANAMGVTCGIVASFLLNRFYNFKVKDHAFERFVRFFAVGLLGLAISSWLIYVMVDVWELNAFYSKITTIFIVALIQFILNKLFTFRPKQ